MMPFFKRHFKAKEHADENIDQIVKYKGNLFLKIPQSIEIDQNINIGKFYSILIHNNYIEELDSQNTFFENVEDYEIDSQVQYYEMECLRKNIER